MSYQDDLKAAFAAQLDCDSDDIVDVEVIWDSGSSWDSMDGTRQGEPTFEVRVLQLSKPRSVTLDTAFTFTELLRMALGVGGYRPKPAVPQQHSATER